MTEELKKPGVAWNLAAEAMKRGDKETAQRMLEYMLPSDRKLMEQRLAEPPR